MTVGMINTVLGTVSPTDLGITLPHEHLFVHTENWFVEPKTEADRTFANTPVRLSSLTQLKYRPYSNWDNVHLDDYETVLAEVRRFKDVGGGTIVDLSSSAIGQDVAKMKQVSEESGVHVVAGCGYYVATAHPPDLRDRNVQQITDTIVGELRDGIGNTGICAGVIGEVGTTHPIDPVERKVLEASAAAHTETGAPISVHLSNGPPEYWLEVLTVLEDNGADPSKVALGHLDGYRPFDLKTHATIAERGAYVEYDIFGLLEFSEDGFWAPPPSDLERVEAVRELWEMGHGERILLSHDVCLKMQQIAYGGLGFAHLPAHVAPVMRSLGGLSDQQIETMFQTNPARWLAWSS